jgi:hypothetical protein
MMTFKEYVERAEDLCGKTYSFDVEPSVRMEYLAEAQVMATLAVAHATMEASHE